MKISFNKRHIQIASLLIGAAFVCVMIYAFMPTPNKIVLKEDIMQAKHYEEGFEEDVVVREEKFDVSFDDQIDQIIKGNLEKSGDIKDDRAELPLILKPFEEKPEPVLYSEKSDANQSEPLLSERNEQYTPIDPDLRQEQIVVFDIEEKKSLNYEVTQIAPPKEQKITELPKTNKPKIAIVIDDMGMNFSRLKELSQIAHPINFAFLPYAENLDEQTQYALDNQHHLIVHMPMKPKSDSVDPGPVVLKPGMSKQEINKALDWGLGSFKGFKGINNHMGSAFTEDLEGMRTVMAYLKKQGSYFLDSKTTAQSKGRQAANEIGLPVIVRDVFLDHKNELSYIQNQLKITEAVALRNGSAIAIGHPYLATIEALQKWMPMIEQRGFELVTVEQLINEKALIVNKNTEPTISLKIPEAKAKLDQSRDNKLEPASKATSEVQTIKIEQNAY